MRAKSRWVYWSMYALLLILWALLALGARRLSFTMDEPNHIARGYTFLARWKGGFWYFPFQSHPPLLDVAEALLMFLTRPRVPLETLDGWGQDFASYAVAFTPYLMPMERTEVLARTPVMFLTLLLSALVFRWGKEIGGRSLRAPAVGVLAAAFLTFDPLILAHGRVATTDMGVTAVGTAALYAAWRWVERPSWKWTAVTGGLLGLTMLAKFSGVLWCAAFGLVALGAVIQLLQPGRGLAAAPRRLRALQSATVGAVALCLIWMAMGFSFGLAGSLPFPVPAPVYWEALLGQAATATHRTFFALGRIWEGRQWWYFPLNFVIRNPLPLLLVLPIGAWFFFRLALTHRRLLILVLFPCLYILVSITWGMNVSYRHMLPVHPFLYLIAAAGLWSYVQTYQRADRRVFGRCIILGALAAWYIVGTLRLFPDEITYFNELVGGPEGGYRYLGDRTQDWGQSYKELRDYLRAHPGPEPRYAYFTPLHPGFYGVSFRSIFPSAEGEEEPAPFHPRPGRYVIGVSPLYGLTGYPPEKLDWFRRATPTAMVGHALLVYDVADTPRWAAQCTAPAVPLNNDAIAGGFGRTDVRRVDFDCRVTWLYPGGGSEVGAYALHHDLLTEQGRRLPDLLRRDPVPSDRFVARHLAGTRLSYEQRKHGLLPAFALYERAGSPPAIPPPLPTRPAPVEALPGTLVDVPTLSLPVPLNGPLSFLGVRVISFGDDLEVETWWRVTDGEITRLFSVMGHLLAEDGQVLGVEDGLGISPLMLAPGDVLVQRHRFPHPPAGTPIWLRTGVYWLDTMEQWPVAGATEAEDHALFVALQVK